MKKILSYILLFLMATSMLPTTKVFALDTVIKEVEYHIYWDDSYKNEYWEGINVFFKNPDTGYTAWGVTDKDGIARFKFEFNKGAYTIPDTIFMGSDKEFVHGGSVGNLLIPPQDIDKYPDKVVIEDSMNIQPPQTASYNFSLQTSSYNELKTPVKYEIDLDEAYEENYLRRAFESIGEEIPKGFGDNLRGNAKREFYSEDGKITIDNLKSNRNYIIKMESAEYNFLGNSGTNLLKYFTRVEDGQNVNKTILAITGKYNISYLDEFYNELAPTVYKDDLKPGTYTEYAIDIDGYEVVGDSVKNVEVMNDYIFDQGISFTYRRKTVTPPQPIKGSYTVKHMDKEGNLLEPETIKNDLDLGTYTEYAKEFKDYKINDYDKVKNVTLTEDNRNQVIIFTYDKVEEEPKPVIKGSYTVRYIDKDGNLLEPETVKNDLDLGIYTEYPRSFEGYKVLDDVYWKVIRLTEYNKHQVVEFVYEKIKEEQKPVIKGSYRVQYKDIDGKLLEAEILKADLDLGTYTEYAKKFEGYELVGNTDKQEITLTEDNKDKSIVIVFTYKKIESPVIEKPKEEPKEEEQKPNIPMLPQTGDSKGIVLPILGLLLSGIGVVLCKRK